MDVPDCGGHAVTNVLRRPSFWLHLGFALAVVALALTRAGRMVGMFPPPADIDLMSGEAMQIEDAVVSLKRFSVPRYTSGRPKQYVSEVHCMTGGGIGAVEKAEISVNRPLVRGDWWIYQSGWGEDEQGTYTLLKCVYDPFLPLAFAGWVTMLAGSLALAVSWWRRASAEEGCAKPVSALRRVLPYVAAAVLSAVPAYFIGRSVLSPDRIPALQSPLLFPHILAYFVSYVIFLFAAFGLLRRLWGAAYFLMTLGLVLGALWGKICWGEWWQFDPKEMWSLATWLVYGLFFHVRLFHVKTHKAGRRLERVLLVAGAALIMLTLLWVNFSKLFSGLHSYV